MHFTISFIELDYEEAYNILINFKPENNFVTKIEEPKGGQCYIVYNDDANKKDDWRVDGVRWRNDGQKSLPRKFPIIRKTYYKMVKPDNSLSSEFTKNCFRLIDDETKVLVQYIIFLRILKSGLDNIKENNLIKNSIVMKFAH